MAAKRMFSKSITNSSKFLMMPESSQNLYFHLGMNADDDGFCEHFTVMRMVGSKPDDLKILQAKNYIRVFDDHVLVIVDWKENNLIRSDRYSPSKYLEIYKEEVKLIGSGIPNDNQMDDIRDTQDRLGKDRLGKDRESAYKFYPPSLPEILSYMKEIHVHNPEHEANQFLNYHSSKGWIVGRSKMKDWKAAVRTWKGNQEKWNPQPVDEKPNRDEERAAILRGIKRGVVPRHEIDAAVKAGLITQEESDA